MRQLSTVHRVGMHGITDGKRSCWTSLRDSVLSFPTPAPTLLEANFQNVDKLKAISLSRDRIGQFSHVTIIVDITSAWWFLHSFDRTINDKVRTVVVLENQKRLSHKALLLSEAKKRSLHRSANGWMAEPLQRNIQ